MIEFDENALKNILDACIATQEKKRVASDMEETMAMVLMLGCSEKINTVTDVLGIFYKLTAKEKLLFAGRVYDLVTICDDIIKQHEDIAKETSDENDSTKQ